MYRVDQNIYIISINVIQLYQGLLYQFKAEFILLKCAIYILSEFKLFVLNL